MIEFPKDLIVGKYQLKLLPATISLAQEVFNIYNSDVAAMIYWQPNGLPKRVEDVLIEMVENEASKKWCMYYVYENAKLLGQVGLSNVGWKHGVGRIGYWLSKDARGKGVVSSVLPEIERLGFEDLNMRKLVINCAGDNLSSRKVAERHGYKLDAVCRQDVIYPDGSIHDDCEYSKLKSEWEKGKVK